ncbi:hypothetical protein BCR35DRAFT_302960 [Leucosporidium creatinivorum]|uniref:SET domain-containing protein n=1 Tax=Leucosporidium creatinivorum TaxID=106004 RepID=A0A1Y2FPL5_9BASI|nr:hypothetical protein BCR35DRAFT_302960 [Leucosporidium creatinivorum]
MTAPAQTSTAEEASFFSWLTTNGATISPALGLSSFPGMGRGAIALEDIQPDTLLFALPRPLLLTTSTSKLPSLLPDGAFSTLGGWTPLILILMYESLHPETSLWTPYFSLLPKTDSFHSLMFWEAAELEDLQGSMVLGKVGKEEAEEEFETVLKPFVEEHESALGPKEGYTLERFHWCGSLVLSRSFHVDAKEEEEESDDEEEEEEEKEDVADVAMVPMADLLNAKSGADNARLFYEPLTLNMMSTSFIPKGSQIFNTYADPPNSDLLRRYGHVDDENEADLVEIGLESVVDLVGEAQGLSEEEREERAEFLLECGVDDTFSLDRTLTLPTELLSAIRTFLLSKPDFVKQVNKESPPRGKLDSQIAEWAVKLIQKREAEYLTSIEDDLALLALPSTDVPLRKRMAVVVRLGEKQILKGTREKTIEEVAAEAKAEKDGKKRTREEKGDKGGKRSKTGK